MKKFVACLLLVMGAVGCVTTQPGGSQPQPTWKWGTKEPAAKPVETAKVEKALPPKPVTPDQVTPNNAHKVVDSLQRELDQANEGEK